LAGKDGSREEQSQMEEVSKHCQSMANEDGRVDPEKGFRKFIKE